MITMADFPADLQQKLAIANADDSDLMMFINQAVDAYIANDLIMPAEQDAILSASKEYDDNPNDVVSYYKVFQ